MIITHNYQKSLSEPSYKPGFIEMSRFGKTMDHCRQLQMSSQPKTDVTFLKMNAKFEELNSMVNKPEYPE